ncbi:MAG TPA: hypothetical protein PKD86_15255, partial [Gemmatales bacterium]|nr:hypothetical protein [Gemmatales bacterium]
PLPVLNHVGGSPILALATRTGGWVESYRNFAKWTRKGYGWFDEIATELAPEEFTVNYKKVMKVAEPICRRLDETTEKLLLPALADGQTAFVLDAKITSTQWQALMPESKKPLPLPEFALVCGVSDAGKLRQAFSAYRAAGNELFAKLHELFPDEVQPFEIPEPTTARIDEGTLYYYPLPSMLGFDEQIQPNAGLNDRVAVLTLSKEHSGRLLRSTPLAARFAALRDSRRPIHAATYFSFQELLAGVEPWVDFVLSEAPELQGDVLPNEVRTQIMQGLRIARVLGTYESITYEEGSAWVTHGKWTVQDLKD